MQRHHACPALQELAPLCNPSGASRLKVIVFLINAATRHATVNEYSNLLPLLTSKKKKTSAFGTLSSCNPTPADTVSTVLWNPTLQPYSIIRDGEIGRRLFIFLRMRIP